MFCNSTITDLFLFVFTQLILHYQKELLVMRVSFYSISYFVKVLGIVDDHGTLAVIIVIIFAFVERLVYVKKFKN